ncbi:alkaline phosphatase family protein [bacterium]|nr:MAG: alkaline phosphatase family protein [bacterium]
MKIFCCLFLIYFLSGCSSNNISSADNLPRKRPGVFRVAFGSCSKHNRPQPLWKYILQGNPDVWVWLGDVIYADTKNMKRMARKYQLQKANPDYQKLVETIPVIGIWDDHDYGKNGANRTYSQKRESQRLFLDFLDVPADSPRRSQEGVYASYLFGTEKNQIKIILLDERYFRERKGENSDILGEIQWRWFENELTDSRAQIHLIGSSTQIVGRDHFHDKWADFPKSEKRLYELLKRTRVKNVVILAGDRHFSEISKFQDAPIGYPLYEITSSGMTHHKTGFWQNLFRLEQNRYRISGPFYELNYGIVDIDLVGQLITLYICDQTGKVRLKQEIHLEEIQPH